VSDLPIKAQQLYSAELELYYRLGITALELLLRTNAIPQRLDYFFNPTDATGGTKRLIKDTQWQMAFMAQLAAKDAVTSSGNYFAAKNRFFLETLLKEARTRHMNRFIKIISEVTGLPIPDLPSPPESKIAPPPQTAAPAPPQTATPPAPESEEEMENVQEPEREERSDVTDEAILNVLTKMNDMLSTSLEIQSKLAENIIYVRDRGDKLHEKVKHLDEQLTIIYGAISGLQMPEVPQNQQDVSLSPEATAQMELVIDSVNSITGVVNSIKDEVKQTMSATIQATETGRLARIQGSLSKISSEFEALRELTLEFLPVESAR
jgi:hypothetical protein